MTLIVEARYTRRCAFSRAYTLKDGVARRRAYGDAEYASRGADAMPCHYYYKDAAMPPCERLRYALRHARYYAAMLI